MPDILVYKIIESNEAFYIFRKFLLLHDDYYRIIYTEQYPNI